MVLKWFDVDEVLFIISGLTECRVEQLCSSVNSVGFIGVRSHLCMITLAIVELTFHT